MGKREPMSQSTALTLGFILTSALLFTACQLQTTPATPSPTPAAVEEQVSASPASSPMAKVDTPDGIAEVETSYMSPAGEEKVGFTIVVDADGVITDAKTNIMAKAPTSVMRQESFAKELPKVLMGKKLASLTKVDRVGGSSLTTGAFNAALEELQSQI